jgi:hypothetical protein
MGGDGPAQRKGISTVNRKNWQILKFPSDARLKTLL